MTGHIDPTKETFAAFRSSDRAGPIHMLNLVRFRDKAAYSDGRSATGAEAYAAYGRDSHPVFSDRFRIRRLQVNSRMQLVIVSLPTGSKLAVPTIGVIRNRPTGRRYDVLQADTENWVRGDHTHPTEQEGSPLAVDDDAEQGARDSGNTRVIHSLANGPAPCCSTQE